MGVMTGTSSVEGNLAPQIKNANAYNSNLALPCISYRYIHKGAKWHLHICMHKTIYGSIFCNGKCLKTNIREYVKEKLWYSGIQYSLLKKFSMSWDIAKCKNNNKNQAAAQYVYYITSWG